MLFPVVFRAWLLMNYPTIPRNESPANLKWTFSSAFPTPWPQPLPHDMLLMCLVFHRKQEPRDSTSVFSAFLLKICLGYVHVFNLQRWGGVRKDSKRGKENRWLPVVLNLWVMTLPRVIYELWYLHQIFTLQLVTVENYNYGVATEYCWGSQH